MDEQILNFLNKDRICVISVPMEDESLHSAAVHFSFQESPFKFYIQTSKTSLKAKPFLGGATKNGAIVIGFSEQDWITLQMHGSVRAVLDPNEAETVAETHYKKQPQAKQRKGPNSIFMEFTPTWYRFTDFNTKPPTIITG